MEFKLDNTKIQDGTVLLFGIRYPRMRDSDKVFTYVLLRAGGLCYVTGSGRVPIAAGWGAVDNWLNRDGRVVEWVKIVTDTKQLWPEVKGP